jgi:hypothetical protein
VPTSVLSTRAIAPLPSANSGSSSTTLPHPLKQSALSSPTIGLPRRSVPRLVPPRSSTMPPQESSSLITKVRLMLSSSTSTTTLLLPPLPLASTLWVLLPKTNQRDSPLVSPSTSSSDHLATQTHERGTVQTRHELFYSIIFPKHKIIIIPIYLFQTIN